MGGILLPFTTFSYGPMQNVGWVQLFCYLFVLLTCVIFRYYCYYWLGGCLGVVTAGGSWGLYWLHVFHAKNGRSPDFGAFRIYLAGKLVFIFQSSGIRLILSAISHD